MTVRENTLGTFKPRRKTELFSSA